MTRKENIENYPFDHETARELGELQENKAENFVRRVVGRRKEGISADRVGFLHGRYGGNHMIPNPNKQ
ncbi:MAG TPA: hypothetical protein GXX19_10205 [Syntrophomonadaceae bacterium]|nr:hypothetical protein [Syntrophomonadaceae bacterium]